MNTRGTNGGRNKISPCEKNVLCKLLWGVLGYINNFSFTMTNVIALTQFIIICIGTFAVMVLQKAASADVLSRQNPEYLSPFLARYGFFMVLIPIVWTMYAILSDKVGKNIFSLKFAQGVGIVMMILLFLVYFYTIFFLF
ncbi:MAG: hypothetical protein SGI98_01760 [Verrucomicrobiota bacterium]|nr:hypothetical protein [Verrucomicrobiota bacterium]